MPGNVPDWEEFQMRSSGILLPLSSLPSPYGIGSAGSDAYAFVDFLKAAGDTPVFTLQSGDEIRFGGVRLRVLWPREETGGNEGSLVLLLEYDGRRMLFTGDIGEEEEEQLLAGLCDVDVLKVAHHGSKYSTTQAFLEAVRPEVALISAGRGNSYGFPAPETLERLKEAGSETYVTAESGAISVVVRQGELFVETMLRETEE